MKKTLLSVIVLICSLTAVAQVTIKPGVRGGINFARLTNTDLDTKTDFYFSAFGALKLSRFYTMQPEIGYSRQGAEGTMTYYDSFEDIYYTENLNVKLEYVTLTFINKFTLTDSFNIHVGPTFDIGANTRSEYVDDIDLGITAGIAYTLPFGLAVEARIKKGLVDVMDDYYYNDNDYYYGDDNVNSNIVFQVGLSYSFDVTGTNK